MSLGVVLLVIGVIALTGNFSAGIMVIEGSWWVVIRGVVAIVVSCPQGSCPGGSCPRGSCPRGSCPRGSCPRGSCPRGSCPRGSCPRGSCPGVSCPRGSCPRGSCPRGSCPRGSCPRGSCPVTLFFHHVLLLLILNFQCNNTPNYINIYNIHIYPGLSLLTIAMLVMYTF